MSSAHRLAALELNRKSQMVSEAVEEVLELVQNAAITFRTIIGAENDVLAQGNNWGCNLCCRCFIERNIF